MAQNRTRQLPDAVPPLRRDLVNAMLFMQQSSGESGDSLFDHLSRVIARVIDERPSGVVDHFEQFSERVRRARFRTSDASTVSEDALGEPQRLTIAKRLLPMLAEKSQQQQQHAYVSEGEMKSITTEATTTSAEEEEEEASGDVIYDEAPTSVTSAEKDLCELQLYWNLLGVGLAREETILLSRALRRLRASARFATCRFWGKVLGTSADYYIVECILTEDELDRRIDAIEKAINIMSLESPSEECAPISDHRKSPPSASSEKAASSHWSEWADEAVRSAQSDFPHPSAWNFSINIPQSSYRTPIEIPAEEISRGVNRCVYYVCNNPSGDWIELPSATPHQINVTRRTRKYLTGNLDAPVDSFPSFPGAERNYLRAIIARISAGTHVAPRDFYRKAWDMSGSEEFQKDDEGEEEDDDEDNDKAIKVNDSYRPLSIGKLLRLDYWQHVRPEILEQGRTRYFDGRLLAKYHNSDNEEEEGAFSDDDEGASIDGAHSESSCPEMPAPLFAACSGDRLTNDTISPWTIRLNDVVESPLVLLQSNVWPGAYAFVKERICDNIYIGFGHKYSSVNYSPLALPDYQREPDDEEEANNASEETTTTMMMEEEESRSDGSSEVEA